MIGSQPQDDRKKGMPHRRMTVEGKFALRGKRGKHRRDVIVRGEDTMWTEIPPDLQDSGLGRGSLRPLLAVVPRLLLLLHQARHGISVPTQGKTMDERGGGELHDDPSHKTGKGKELTLENPCGSSAPSSSRVWVLRLCSGSSTTGLRKGKSNFEGTKHHKMKMIDEETREGRDEIQWNGFGIADQVQDIRVVEGLEHGLDQAAVVCTDCSHEQIALVLGFRVAASKQQQKWNMVDEFIAVGTNERSEVLSRSILVSYLMQEIRKSCVGSKKLVTDLEIHTAIDSYRERCLTVLRSEAGNTTPPDDSSVRNSRTTWLFRGLVTDLCGHSRVGSVLDQESNEVGRVHTAGSHQCSVPFLEEAEDGASSTGMNKSKRIEHTEMKEGEKKSRSLARAQQGGEKITRRERRERREGRKGAEALPRPSRWHPRGVPEAWQHLGDSRACRQSRAASHPTNPQRGEGYTLSADSIFNIGKKDRRRRTAHTPDTLQIRLRVQNRFQEFGIFPTEREMDREVSILSGIIRPRREKREKVREGGRHQTMEIVEKDSVDHGLGRLTLVVRETLAECARRSSTISSDGGSARQAQ